MGNLLVVDILNSRTIKLKCDVYSIGGAEVVPVTLIYDTGADKTSITRGVLEGLGYDRFLFSKTYKRTAIGMFKPYKCLVSRLVVGNQFGMDNLTVDVLEALSSPSFDGVLGMDFISCVESVISGSRKQLEISKRL